MRTIIFKFKDGNQETFTDVKKLKITRTSCDFVLASRKDMTADLDDLESITEVLYSSSADSPTNADSRTSVFGRNPEDYTDDLGETAEFGYDVDGDGDID